MPFGVTIAVSSENHPKHKFNTWKKIAEVVVLNLRYIIY